MKNRPAKNLFFSCTVTVVATTLAATLCLAGLFNPVYAQNIPLNHGGFVRTQGGASISAAQAGNLAKSKYGGKVLKITPVKSDDGTNYVVRLLLDDGKVINVTVDGQTGEVG